MRRIGLHIPNTQPVDVKRCFVQSLIRWQGIGPKKRHALLTTFGSLKGLLSASDEEILTVPGIRKK